MEGKKKVECRFFFTFFVEFFTQSLTFLPIYRESPRLVVPFLSSLVQKQEYPLMSGYLQVLVLLQSFPFWDTGRLLRARVQKATTTRYLVKTNLCHYKLYCYRTLFLKLSFSRWIYKEIYLEVAGGSAYTAAWPVSRPATPVESLALLGRNKSCFCCE